MRFPSAKILLAGIAGVSSLFLIGGAGLSRSSGRDHALTANQPAQITIDYSLDGSIFPPEITPPTFLWHDAREAAKRWVVEVSFADHSEGIRVETPGEHLQMGEIDPQTGAGNELIPLTPEQASSHTWTPDSDSWAKIKHASVNSPTTVSFSGFVGDNSNSPVSSGSVTISTSSDPVGAPIFYRDVPLMTSLLPEKGSIQPLPTSALPLIKWRVRDIAETQSHTVMEKLYTCANCHSFSLDGKTLGIDVDGPQNDKGLYALVPIVKNMTISNKDVIRWKALQDNPGAKSAPPSVSRFGFMSQVSPDGHYVVTSIAPPGLRNAHADKNQNFAPGLSARLFSVNYNDIRFTQVFYPTRGILAFYDRKEGKLHHLPGRTILDTCRPAHSGHRMASTRSSAGRRRATRILQGQRSQCMPTTRMKRRSNTICTAVLLTREKAALPSRFPAFRELPKD